MKTVLFIEDDNVVRETTAELLELNNYQVLTASNGIAGVALAKEKMPDIIVCDIMMPQLDGYGVLQELSLDTQTKHIPFIFLSAKTEHSDVRKGMNLGADDYLTKPFEEAELISAIKSRIAKYEILEEQRQQPLESPSDFKIKSMEQLKNEVKKFNLVNFKANEDIYREGQHANRSYLIEKGVVKTTQIDEYGKELITSIYKEGDFFGYSSFKEEHPYQETATTMEESEIYIVPRANLREIVLKNPELSLEMVSFLRNKIVDSKEKMLNMAYGSVRKKTAQTILKFAEKINQTPDLSLRISRSDLASVAGIATESFIRTLSEFKKEGIIAIEGRNIRVLELDKLHQIH